MVLVGVLALQGSFQEHVEVLKRIGANAVEVRTTQDLVQCDGLIIPGGESTTMAHIADKSGMLEALRTFVVVEKKPVWGTCAGLIFLAETAEGVLQQTPHHAIWFATPDRSSDIFLTSRLNYGMDQFCCLLEDVR